jgi:hypothetical protein
MAAREPPEVELELDARGLAVILHPSEPVPEDEVAWVERAVAQPGEVRIVGVRPATTVDGWPVLLVRSDVGARHWLHALYRVDQLGIVAAVAIEPGVAVERAVEVLLSARPRFAPGIVALAQVWADA